MSTKNVLKRLALAPESEYYAIVDETKKYSKTPVLAIIDKTLNEEQREKIMENDPHTVVLHDYKQLTMNECQKLLDITSSHIGVYKLPVSSSQKGSVVDVSENVGIFSE